MYIEIVFHKQPRGVLLVILLFVFHDTTTAVKIAPNVGGAWSAVWTLVIIFCARRSRGKMYSGHGRLCHRVFVLALCLVIAVTVTLLPGAYYMVV